MTIVISAEHQTARETAARLPALHASLALLTTGAGTAYINIYDEDDALLARVPLASAGGVVDELNHTIVLTTPIEGQITTAGEAHHATLTRKNGNLWMQGLEVSTDSGAGHIKISGSVTLHVGAFVRITSAVIQG